MSEPNEMEPMIWLAMQVEGGQRLTFVPIVPSTVEPIARMLWKYGDAFGRAVARLGLYENGPDDKPGKLIREIERPL